MGAIDPARLAYTTELGIGRTFQTSSYVATLPPRAEECDGLAMAGDQSIQTAPRQNFAICLSKINELIRLECRRRSPDHTADDSRCHSERRHRQDNAFLTFRRRFVFVNSAKNDLLSSPP